MGPEGRLGPAQGGQQLRRPRQVRRLPGRVAARGRGPALAAEGLRGAPRLGLRDRRQHRPAEGADQHRRLPHRLRDVQRHHSRRRLSARRRLAVDRAVRPAPPPPRRRAPGAAPRRHLLHARPRPALGDQAPEVAGDRHVREVQEARHRPGRRAAQGAPDDQVPLHHAEAARGAVRARVAEGARHHRHLLRRHRDDAAVPPLRRRGAVRGRLLRADLRQHADGPGDAPRDRAGRGLGDRLLPAGAARDDRSRRSRAARSSSSTTATPAASASPR